MNDKCCSGICSVSAKSVTNPLSPAMDRVKRHTHENALIENGSFGECLQHAVSCITALPPGTRTHPHTEKLFSPSASTLPRQSQLHSRFGQNMRIDEKDIHRRNMSSRFTLLYAANESWCQMGQELCQASVQPTEIGGDATSGALAAAADATRSSISPSTVLLTPGFSSCAAPRLSLVLPPPALTVL
jgi:hypothetical protein